VKIIILYRGKGAREGEKEMQVPLHGRREFRSGSGSVPKGVNVCGAFYRTNAQVGKESSYESTSNVEKKKVCFVERWTGVLVGSVVEV